MKETPHVHPPLEIYTNIKSRGQDAVVFHSPYSHIFSNFLSIAHIMPRTTTTRREFNAVMQAGGSSSPARNGRVGVACDSHDRPSHPAFEEAMFKKLQKVGV